MFSLLRSSTLFTAVTCGKRLFSGSARLAEAATASSQTSHLFEAALQEAQQDQTVSSSSELLKSSQSSTSAAALRTFIFKTPTYRTSPWKSNVVAKTIRGLPLLKAIDQMEFNKKRPAAKIKSMLVRAADVLERQKNSDRKNWIVKQAYVGKGRYYKRNVLHGRGRFGVMHHPASHVKVILEELPQTQWNETKEQMLKRREFEKLVHIFRRHKLYVPLSDAQPVRSRIPPWSFKPYKYITSDRWVDPSNAYSKTK
ncbi:54S ribosomal protein L22, mitochondrial [Chytridiales sp. JEL 0842]|nr:54S ribosomal protein L22, mitochondrial [Chytridiales sp. JEL 0842]